MPVTRISQSPINVSFLRYEREICTEINQREKKVYHLLSGLYQTTPWAPVSWRTHECLLPWGARLIYRDLKRPPTVIGDKGEFRPISQRRQVFASDLQSGSPSYLNSKQPQACTAPQRNNLAEILQLQHHGPQPALPPHYLSWRRPWRGGSILNQQMAPGGRWGSGTAMVTSSVCRREGGK